MPPRVWVIRMITLSAVNYSVGERALFTDLSLSFQKKKYGLVGPNGIGKTTLARIVAGIIGPASGQVQSSCKVGYFTQVESAANMGLGEYLASIWDADGRYREEITELVESLDLDRCLNQLSGGEWMRARFARLLATDPEFLILDEPSNNLDRDGREFLTTFLKTYGGGLLLISHDRELLRQVDIVIELSNQGASIYGGNFDLYWDRRQSERIAHGEELSDLKRLAKKTSRDSFARRDQQAKRMRHGKKRIAKLCIPRMQAGAMKRTAQITMGSIHKDTSEHIRQSVSRISESWESMKLDPFLRLDFEGAQVPAGKTVLSLHQVNWQFEDAPLPLWKMPLDFCIQGSQRCQILGSNGSGKSTLAKLIASPDFARNGTRSGELSVGKNEIAYLDQKYGMLDPNLSVLEQLEAKTRFSKVELRNELAFYGFTGDSVLKKVKVLSGGELLKACLAHIFLEEKIPEVLLLDEPTNNLDFVSIELLEKAVSAFRGAVIVISHDAEFVNQLGIERWIELKGRGR